MMRLLLQLLIMLTALVSPVRFAHAVQLSHELLLTLNPEQARLHGRDRITLLSSASARSLALQLGEGLIVESIEADGRALNFTRDADTLRLELPQGTKRFTVHYSGRLDRSEPPMLTPQASWLPGEFAWFPRFGENDPIELTVVAPAGQRAVLTGMLMHESHGQESTRVTFRAYPGSAPELFAGPYVTEERHHRGLRLRTYFHQEIAEFAPAYLDDAARHIERFSEIIGPYPYPGFDVVSALHPVGLGYAGLSYVSRKIVPLPFMRAKSLPHEILHAWWGNAVRVRADSGNWAEGLTTYMADYGLSDAAGRLRMRREWLRDHEALPAADHHALARFRGQVHARDQVIGYGKGAFVFHMLERHIGTHAFHRGLASFYAAHRNGTAGWEELEAAFETASGQRLDRFFRQWVHRVGAPELLLERVDFKDRSVRLTLVQRGEPYALEVPLEIETQQGRETHLVSTTAQQQTLEVGTRARPLALHVDPEQQLFRRLAAAEKPPILRDVTLLPAVQTVFASLPPGGSESARVLARRLLRSDAAPVDAAAWNPRQPALVVGIGAPAVLAAELGLPEPQLPARPGSAFAWMVQGAQAPTLVVAAEDLSSLEALSGPLPHYSRESWLLFQGKQVLERGLWPAAAASSPLSARRHDSSQPRPGRSRPHPEVQEPVGGEKAGS